MKVLHITSWYPHTENPLEAIWIKRLIDALDAENQVYHISVATGQSLSIKHRATRNVVHRMWRIPTHRWFLLETVNFLLLVYYLWIKRIHRNFDIINFHIAYPQLTYWVVLKAFVKKPVIVSEHWSAYHFNFGVDKPLRRVRAIFRQELPLITVSRSLANDIERFAATNLTKVFHIPNVVDTTRFKLNVDQGELSSTFFMMSQWKWPKKPAIIVEAFGRFIACPDRSHYVLRVAGYGPDLAKMRALTESLLLTKNVMFLGPMEPESIAGELNSCVGFLHCSEYETFSVVCAEALCCGTPVAASNVGGIPEYLNARNGILVNENTVDGWVNAMILLSRSQFDRVVISEEARPKFGADRIGAAYLDTLKIACGSSK